MGPFKKNSLLYKLTSKVILLSQCLKVENFNLVEGGMVHDSLKNNV